ncbi:hypothetical protein [Lichenicoccus sp.]|uniref:hypothetical protein n=1 Tax=Lichenicoccus sp. TaxID=2781899 RepID=UPI003D0FC1CA
MRFCQASSAPRPLALALLLLAAACDPREITVNPALAQFDGLYRGSETSDQVASACGTTGSIIKFEVSDGQVAVQTHRHSGRLLGTVGADGQLVMQNADGSRQLSGAIQDGVLTAVETSSSTSNQDPYASAAPPCTSTIRATRIS